jgi:hypothetical protein
MRSCFALILLFRMSGTPNGQSPHPAPVAAASPQTVPQASADRAAAAAPAKQNLEQTLVAAHQDLEHGKPQEAIAILEQ